MDDSDCMVGSGKKSKRLINFERIHWGAFTKAFNTFKKRMPEEGIDDLHHFAHFVMENPEYFKKITQKRARFYINIIAKEHSKMEGGVRASMAGGPEELRAEQRQWIRDAEAMIDEFIQSWRFRNMRKFQIEGPKPLPIRQLEAMLREEFPRHIAETAMVNKGLIERD